MIIALTYFKGDKKAQERAKHKDTMNEDTYLPISTWIYIYIYIYLECVYAHGILKIEAELSYDRRKSSQEINNKNKQTNKYGCI